MKTSTIEVEVSGAERNQNLIFPPLSSKRIRGKLDPQRASRHDKEANTIFADFGDVIPGQVIGLTYTDGEKLGAAYVRDPLVDDPQFEVMREKVKARKYRLPPAREDFPAVHATTFLHWLKRAVEDGVCVVIAGKLPDEIDSSAIEFKTPFASASQTRKDPTVRLAEAIEKQTETFERVLLELLKNKKG